MVDWGTWTWPEGGRKIVEPCPVTSGMLLIIGPAAGATEVTTGVLGDDVVVGAPLLTEFCATVVTATAFGFEIPVFVGSFAVATGELLTHSLTRTASSALVEAAICDMVSRNSD